MSMDIFIITVFVDLHYSYKNVFRRKYVGSVCTNSSRECQWCDMFHYLDEHLQQNCGCCFPMLALVNDDSSYNYALRGNYQTFYM